MLRSVNRPRLSQPTLFTPNPPRLSFRTLPPDIREKTIRSLARLLRVHVESSVRLRPGAGGA
jgi:hypothetical protein